MGWLVGVRVRAWIRCADARIRCAGGLGVSQSGLVCGGDFNVCNHLSADIKACVGTPQFFFLGYELQLRNELCGLTSQWAFICTKN